jgi:hypothetical protein
VFSTRILTLVRSVFLCSLLFFISACAGAPKPLTGLVPGREVETINSAVQLSAKAGEQSTSGRGFLLFKKPDSFHLAVVNPFGLSVLEVFSNADRLTYLVPSREVAYSGLISELPETTPLKSLGMLDRVLASPATPAGLAPGVREMTTESGELLQLDERGLVVRRVSPQGDEITYKNYRNINGIAFPESIEIASRFGGVLKIVFDDPELNQPVEDTSLTPDLAGYRVLPLWEFKGL